MHRCFGLHKRSDLIEQWMDALRAGWAGGGLAIGPKVWSVSTRSTARWSQAEALLLCKSLAAYEEFWGRERQAQRPSTELAESKGPLGKDTCSAPVAASTGVHAVGLASH